MIPSLKRLKNPYLWAYGAAILLHILLLVLEKPLSQAFFIPPAIEPPPVSSPLTFEFVDAPKSTEPEQEPPETHLVSERNQVAQDAVDEPLPEGHLAFSDGISQAKELVAASDFEAQKPQDEAHRGETETPQEAVDPAFSFADVLQKNSEQAQKEREQAVLGGATLPKPKVTLDNAQSRALARGGLQLSTYAWNFAPYLAYLKQHIGSNIFPPRAFDLGLIEGTTRVKFRIWRDGRLDGPELVDTKGNAMLRDTSLKAVELSAPFRELPPDFPDEYLDIIGTFEFLVLRHRQGRR